MKELKDGYLSVREYSKAYNITVPAAYKRIRTGKVETVTFHGLILVKVK